MEEIEIVYDNVWDFLVTHGEVYVLRASYIRPGKYVCRHKNEERECTVDNVIEANPITMGRYLDKSGFSSLPEWVMSAARAHMEHVRGGPFRKALSLMGTKYLLHIVL